MGCFSCFDGGNKEQRKEQDRLASDEARAKAAEAAQKRSFSLHFYDSLYFLSYSVASAILLAYDKYLHSFVFCFTLKIFVFRAARFIRLILLISKVVWVIEF